MLEAEWTAIDLKPWRRMRDFQRWAFLAALPLVVGCKHHRRNEVPKPLRLDGVRFSAQSRIVGTTADSLLVTVAATNQSTHEQWIGFSGCRPGPVEVSVRRAHKKWNSNAWEASKVPVYHDSTGGIMQAAMLCSGVAAMRLEARASLHFVRQISVRDMLGDSLPPGRYKITARLHAYDQSTDDLHAGEIELRLPPT
jgi:hypothetical protein